MGRRDFESFRSKRRKNCKFQYCKDYSPHNVFHSHPRIGIFPCFRLHDKKFDGIAIRAPIICGSIVDVTVVAKRAMSTEEVNAILRKAAADHRWEGIFTATDEELVSSDIVGMAYGSIADLGLTRVVGGTLVKVCAWYDNEWGYVSTLYRHVLKAGSNV